MEGQMDGQTDRLTTEYIEWLEAGNLGRRGAAAVARGRKTRHGRRHHVDVDDVVCRK